MIRIGVFFWLLVLIMQLQSSVLIYLKKEVGPQTKLCLSDIASLAGKPVTAELKSISLQPVSHQRFLLKPDVDQFIRRQFPRLEFRLFGPDTIWISSQTLYFSQKELHRNLLFFLASQLDWPESLIRIDYKKDLDFTGITCNVDRVSFENRQVLRSGGICNMTLRLFHDTVCLASYRLPVFLTLLDHYLTVKEPVQPGIGIMEDLLIQKELPRKSGSRKPLKTAQALQGAISRRLLKPGNVLYEQDFDFPIMVKKNQNIVITYQINDIQLTATVQALRDGKLWQTIQALNPSSQQEIQVKITGAGKGEVIL